MFRTLIYRIKYDFTTNTLAAPNGPAASTDAPPTTDNFATGDCITDQMNIAGPGGIGSPTICGQNSGQHSKTFKDILEIFAQYFCFQCSLTAMAHRVKR